MRTKSNYAKKITNHFSESTKKFNDLIVYKNVLFIDLKDDLNLFQ